MKDTILNPTGNSARAKQKQQGQKLSKQHRRIGAESLLKTALEANQRELKEVEGKLKSPKINKNSPETETLRALVSLFKSKIANINKNLKSVQDKIDTFNGKISGKGFLRYISQGRRRAVIGA